MPAGEIDTVIYWYSGLEQWMPLLASPPQVPLNTELFLSCYWVNRGQAGATGRISAVVTRPDGAEAPLEVMLNQDKYADPGNGWGVRLASIALDQPGSYSGVFTLEMDEAGAPVSVTLRGRNAPSNAAYWAAVCASYPTCPIVGIDVPIAWENIPPGTSQDFILVACYDAGLSLLQDLPNINTGVGFSEPFEDGRTYYWDFSTGLLLDENLSPMERR
jgi:hypothetical protein